MSACACGVCAFRAAAAAAAAEQPPAAAEDAAGRTASWAERFFAHASATGMDKYEAAVETHKSALFERVFAVREDLVQSLAPPGIEGMEAVIRDRLRIRNVLELGIGAGPNIKYYAAQPWDIHVTGLDVNPATQQYCLAAADAAGLPRDQLKLVLGDAAALPFPDASFDAVVCTLVLCSVESVPAVLDEVRRVLRHGAPFAFIEHVKAPPGRPLLRTAQVVLNPLQQVLAQGCHLTRDTLSTLLEEVPLRDGVTARRFTQYKVDTVQLNGMGPLSPNIVGYARRNDSRPGAAQPDKVVEGLTASMDA